MPSSKSSSSKSSNILLYKFLLLLVYLNNINLVHSKIQCLNDSICKTKIHPTRSYCNKETKFCTNPFIDGCLYAHNLTTSKRICNSNDNTNLFCTIEPLRYLNYTEIRIHPADWDSSIFLSWMYQIILSELLNVPVSIERGNGRTDDDDDDDASSSASLSFYDMDNNYEEVFPTTSYSIEGIETSLLNVKNYDCRTTNEACAHLLPEVWPGTDPIDNTADVLFTGQMGIEGFWMPKYTIEEYPILGTYFGLQNNRHLLASIFKRPTTWAEYCLEVSTTNCMEDDGIAKRRPREDDEDEEGSKYYVEGLYIGHFRFTNKNNCTIHPTNCSGHIVDYPCSWKPYTEQQFYWNNISMTSENSNQQHYTGSSVKEIFHAANTTKSHVMVLWWKPDPTFDQFDYVRISLPFPTTTCISNRRPTINRCTATKEELIGSPLGSCDFATLPLEKIIAKSLKEQAFNTPLDIRSPAYEFITSFTFQNIQIEELLQNWYQRDIDRYGYDPRYAVCDYVVNHLEELQSSFVPPGYPRIIGKTKDVNYYDFQDNPLPIIALLFASISTIFVMITFVMTIYYRNHHVMKDAQIIYLYMFCFGYLLVSIGAILTAMLPSNWNCIAREWFVLVGYTIALVPLATKMTTIMRLIRQANMMRKLKVSQTKMYVAIVVMWIICIVFLLIWTILDRPTKSIDIVLRDNDNNNDNTDTNTNNHDNNNDSSSDRSRRIVDAYVLCSSESLYWGAIALGWEGILIFYSFVLAWQAKRNLRKHKLSELTMIVNMAYVSFIVFIFRSFVFYLPVNAVTPDGRAGADSILLSIDSIFSILVYFGPKFFLIRSNNKGDDDDDDVMDNTIFNNKHLSCMLPGSNVPVECPQCTHNFTIHSSSNNNNNNNNNPVIGFGQQQGDIRNRRRSSNFTGNNNNQNQNHHQSRPFAIATFSDTSTTKRENSEVHKLSSFGLDDNNNNKDETMMVSSPVVLADDDDDDQAMVESPPSPAPKELLLTSDDTNPIICYPPPR